MKYFYVNKIYIGKGTLPSGEANKIIETMNLNSRKHWEYKTVDKLHEKE